MEHIWAPWRMEYIRMEKPAGCILCEKPGEERDEENLILYRGKSNFIIMNTYPYNPGHLMVVPYRHISSLEDMEEDERNEHFLWVSKCVEVLRDALNPGGFNLGINLGKVAGAGIDSHVHTHIVPRWQGDTNFMPVAASVRVIPEALSDTYKALKEKF